MNKKLLAIFITSITLSFIVNNVVAEGLRWKKVKTVAFSINQIPKGKIISNYNSPDKKYQLIYQKDISGNQALYIKSAKSYKFIDNFQEIKKVKWSEKSDKVSFEAIKEINIDEISYWKINYLPNMNVAFSQVLQMKR